ncbi:MAG: hypothetical protein IBX56_02720 [Methylomicrobium sp.]|nr:hypothetical protein [Methylomicrobium sp.]
MKTITKTKNNVTVTRIFGEYQDRINADGDIVYVTKYKDETKVIVSNNGKVVITIDSKDIDRDPKDAPNGAVARLGHGVHWAGKATLDIIDSLISEIDGDFTADEKQEEQKEELVINPAYAHMTQEEIKAAEKRWDDTQNEGSMDGFNPYRDNLWVPINQPQTGDRK